jgi:hypothetical protein
MVQERAISAVPYFVNEYFSSKPDNLNNLMSHYMSQLDVSEINRRGFALALGSLPKNVIQGRLDKILSALIEKTKVTKATELWAEGRRDVVKAINNIVKTVGVAQGHRGKLKTFSNNPDILAAFRLIPALHSAPFSTILSHTTPTLWAYIKGIFPCPFGTLEIVCILCKSINM